jgi:NTP pyrophosphatase (non-canonical NTP hydrolase)
MPAEVLSSDARQKATMAWGRSTITTDVDLETRASRFLEEATELVQASGMTREKAQAVLDYVYGREVGQPFQEVGGVMITLSMLADVQDISVEHAWITEFDRIHQPEVIAKVRARQIEKRAAGL